MNKQPFPTYENLPVECAPSVEVRTLDEGQHTHLTSAYPELSLSNQKDTSQRGTEPSLLLSDPSIPKSTYVSSSQRTTGQPSSTSKGTPIGLQNTALSGPLEKQSQKLGLDKALDSSGALGSAYQKTGMGKFDLSSGADNSLEAYLYREYAEQLAATRRQSTAFDTPQGKLSPLTGLPYQAMTEHRHGALDKQIGGTHYKDLPIQPVEFIHKNGIGFIAGNVIKYVCRYRTKGGTADLLKAKHYIEMLIEQERQDP